MFGSNPYISTPFHERLLCDYLKMCGEVDEYNERFTFDKLSIYKKKFKNYIEKYGEEKPINTSYSWINSLGNSILSYSYIIATNQPYAKKVYDLIEKFEKVKPKKSKAVNVVMILKEIKNIEKEMADAKINGTIRETLKDTLRAFKVLDVSQEKLSSIIETIKYINKCKRKTKNRMPSPPPTLGFKST